MFSSSNFLTGSYEQRRSTLAWWLVVGV